jgi:pimeloyl-ACP methyl ester carboxylesterase
LQDISGNESGKGKAMFGDIQRRMVDPMRRYFARGDREAGEATFINYVFDDSQAWEKMSESARLETMKDAHEWDVVMTKAILFPKIQPQAIRQIHVPTLLLSGAKSYPFLGLIIGELAHLLPDNQSIVFPDAGHQMWYQRPQECRKDVEDFLRVTVFIEERGHLRVELKAARF